MSNSTVETIFAVGKRKTEVHLNCTSASGASNQIIFFAPFRYYYSVGTLKMQIFMKTSAVRE